MGIKNLFISQLAPAVDMTVEEIEGYVENRFPARPLREEQLNKLAELTGIAIGEIRRIATETAKHAETAARVIGESSTKSPSEKSKRPYPTGTSYSAPLMIRDKGSE